MLTSIKTLHCRFLFIPTVLFAIHLFRLSGPSLAAFYCTVVTRRVACTDTRKSVPYRVPLSRWWRGTGFVYNMLFMDCFLVVVVRNLSILTGLFLPITYVLMTCNQYFCAPVLFIVMTCNWPLLSQYYLILWRETCLCLSRYNVILWCVTCQFCLSIF
jgi:hypothetical protein